MDDQKRAMREVFGDSDGESEVEEDPSRTVLYREGICSHVDLMRFEYGIAVISLESDCVLHFTSAKEASSSQKGKEDKGYSMLDKVPVLLKPGSLVLMSGEARYLWKHETNRKPGFQVWEGREIDHKRRKSVTLRRLRVTG